MDELKPRPANSFPLTPLGFLERAATVYGDCLSIVYNDTNYTWSQTHCRCLQLASSIASIIANLNCKYPVVSVIAPNIPAMYELHFAVPMAGAVLNNINTRLDARTISILLRHSESKLVFVDCLIYSIVLEALSLFPPGRKRPMLVLITDELHKLDDMSHNVLTYKGLVEKGDPNFKWIQPKSELDPIVLNYTSGTTSSPKGVVHCHRGSFITTFDSLVDWTISKRPVFLWSLPMFHSNGWSFTWGMAAVGGTNVCLRKFDASVIYSLIEKHGVTHMCGAPVVMNMLANGSPQHLKNPVHVLTGGSPPPAPVLFRMEALGFVVSHGYGLTETGGVIVSCAWKPQWDKLAGTERARLKARQGVRSAGMTEMDVVDPKTGESVKRDGLSLGEIVLRGGCIMLGYLKDPVATSNCLRENGWFYTGDMGVMHPDGYLEIKDRSKDIIISGGENLSSVEVESVLYTNPAIDEAAVVARPDEFWGETPCAFVSLRPDHIMPTEKEIIDYCRARLPHYMAPKTVVVFKEQLPKTSTGKIQKYLLREKAKALGHLPISRY